MLGQLDEVCEVCRIYNLQENLREQSKVPGGDRHPIYLCYTFQSPKSAYFTRNTEDSKDSMASGVPNRSI